MRRTATLILLGLAAVIAAIVLPRYLREGPPRPAPPSPTSGAATRGPQGGAVKVMVHRVQPRILAETITANGTVLANESVELRSEIAGKIVEIAFAEGGRVEEGAVLVKINDSELQAQLRQTHYRIELARTRAERQRQLLGQGSTTQDVYDSAVNEARILEAEADLIRAQLEKTMLRAPFSGVIGLRMVSEGSYITPSSVIATLQDLDRVKIDFSVSERHMERLHVGSPIEFTVAGSAAKYAGRVYAIEPAVNRETRTIILRAQATNTEGRLLPGAFASVRVTLDEIKDAILIPTTAIIPGLNQRSVFVVASGRAARRTVETGIRLDREIQILSGLEPDAMVITTGLLQLRDGTPVDPIDTE